MANVVLYNQYGEPIQKHHAIPVSLGGMDIPENIIELKRSVHQQVHKTLNLDYSEIRRLRLLENDVTKKKSEAMRKQVEIQKKYFSNAPELDDDVLVLHIDAMLSTIQRLRYELWKKTIEK